MGVEAFRLDTLSLFPFFLVVKNKSDMYMFAA